MENKLEHPKNQHQLALWYLFHWQEFSLKDVINDSMFFKFQTRLSDIEQDLGYEIASRTVKKFENRFGRKSKYNLYSALDKNKILEIYDNY